MKYFSVFLIFLQFFGQSQNLKKELPSKTLYLFGKINDNSILLAKNKPDSFDYSIKFSKTNKIILTSHKTQLVDSSFKYVINNKSTLTIIHDTKDSITCARYNSYNNVFRDVEIEFCRASKVQTIKHITDTVHANILDSINNNLLTLYKRNRTRDIFPHDEVFIHTTIESKDTCDLNERIQGEFYKMKNDTLFIDKEGDASGYYAMTGRDTLLNTLTKVKMTHITKISHERENLNAITGVAAGLSAFSTLIVSPLVSLNRSGFNGDRYLKVAGYSLASTLFFATLRITFSYKKMQVGFRRNAWKFSKP